MKRNVKKIIVLLLAAALAISMFSCGRQNQNQDIPENPAAVTDGETVGTGSMEFTLEIGDKDGNIIKATIKTDEGTVGEALLKLGIISGEQGAYGLYIKQVNGITADYNIDGTYWAFYVNGEYALSGVDETECESGAVYSLKAEK